MADKAFCKLTIGDLVDDETLRLLIPESMLKDIGVDTDKENIYVTVDVDPITKTITLKEHKDGKESST